MNPRRHSSAATTRGSHAASRHLRIDSPPLASLRRDDPPVRDRGRGCSSSPASRCAARTVGSLRSCSSSPPGARTARSRPACRPSSSRVRPSSRSTRRRSERRARQREAAGATIGTNVTFGFAHELRRGATTKPAATRLPVGRRHPDAHGRRHRPRRTP